ncbi:MAG: hypothetical protein ACRDYC_02555, partial [Acidimicrobiales bacterium]
MGKSTTQQKANSDASYKPSEDPIELRQAPSTPLAARPRPTHTNTASPAEAPTPATRTSISSDESLEAKGPRNPPSGERINQLAVTPPEAAPASCFGHT